MTQKRVLLIIPAYNEEQNIEATIRQITAYPQQERYVLDYIVIDDGSTGRTGTPASIWYRTWGSAARYRPDTSTHPAISMMPRCSLTGTVSMISGH